MKKPIINKNCDLFVDDGKAFIKYFNEYNEPISYRISKALTIILITMNGRNSTDEIINIISDVFSVEKNIARKYIEKVFKMFPSQIHEAEGETREFDIVSCISRIENYSENDLCISQTPFPERILYNITNRCLFNCIYCYRDSYNTMIEPDTLSFDRWKVLLDNAYEKGCREFNITGGDPFLYSGVDELIKICSENKLETKISTKMILQLDMIERLKHAHLTELQVSIDSIDPGICYKMTGIKNAYDQAIDTIKNAVKLGINVITNTVLTKYNIAKAHELIPFLYSIGVSKINFSSYTCSCGRNNASILASKEEKKQEADYMKNLIDKYGPKIDITYPFKDVDNVNSLDEAVLKKINCGGSKDLLAVRHNGIVGFCDALLYNDNIIIGDLNTQSIEEVWNSPELLEWLTPNREKYINTDCYHCKLFTKCFPKRCYKRSIIAYGTPYEKDPICPYGELMNKIF